MLKKTVITALVLGFSGAASAASFAPVCAVGKVAVPCQSNAWDAGIDALYLRAVDHQLSDQPTNVVSRMPYGFGFRLEGSYHFKTGNDVSLNWSNYGKKSQVIATAAGFTLDNKFNTINFEFGQQVNLSNKFAMRLQGGLQFLDINEQQTINGTAANVVKNELTGYGVRAGAGVSYKLGNGFAVYADSNLAVLKSKFIKFIGAGNAKTTSHTTALSTDSSVGVSYTKPMAQGELTARAGWIIKQVNFNSDGNPPNFMAVPAAITGYGWSGFSFGLKWLGNA